jgi:hypothetical protein
LKIHLSTSDINTEVIKSIAQPPWRRESAVCGVEFACDSIDVPA